MKAFILFMHDDATSPQSDDQWEQYIKSIKSRGMFDGGSSIGVGSCHRKEGLPAETSTRLVGFIRVRADDLAGATQYLVGNPTFECGGTVEIRELIAD